MTAVFMDISPLYRDYPVSYLTISIVCCGLFYYIWLHLEFVKEHENALMAEQRIKLMMSQIQPHFLYNSLSSISELCETDPKKAQQMTDDFSEYLRYNLTALNTEKLVSFEKQLEQTEIYLNIEKTRFEDRVNAVYEIEATDFEVPTLTVQPLVENAVRHGICRRPEGGTVTIVLMKRIMSMSSRSPITALALIWKASAKTARRMWGSRMSAQGFSISATNLRSKANRV